MKTDIVNSSIRTLHFSAELFGQNLIEISFDHGICRSYHLNIFKINTPTLQAQRKDGNIY